MDISQSNWTEADASNSTAAPDGAPEGMFPSGVNDTMRAMMGATKRWYDWTIPTTTAGSSTAYTLTYSVAPGALVSGMTHTVLFNAANGAAATLNVNALGAKPLYYYDGSTWSAVPTGAIPINTIAPVTYDSVAGSYRILKDLSAAQSGSTFLSVDAATAVAATFVAGPTTGSIGLAGQLWLLTSTTTYLNSSGGNMTATARIFNGSAGVSSTSITMTTGFTGTMSLSAVVALSAATTFTLQATDNVGSNLGAQKAGAGGTVISAVRLS